MTALPTGFKIALDAGVRFRAGGRVAVGGSPWRVLRFGAAAVPFMSGLRAAGPRGAVPADEAGRRVSRILLDRGFAHPVVTGRSTGADAVDVVVPTFGSRELSACLDALGGSRVTVVDDGSPDGDAVRAIVESHGVTLRRHSRNRGPAAARNTGLGLAQSELVAFVDADCRPPPGWLEPLVAHFDDPRVGAVAPRILPARPGSGGSNSVLGRYEAARSALDMGPRPQLALPGGRLGFVPSAALVARRHLVAEVGFDEDLRLGEDVDLVWRLTDQGWLVRYEPSVTVYHLPRLGLGEWLGRRYAYGTSAGALAHRHPGRLAPARLSSWSLASIVLVAARRPLLAAGFTGLAAALLHRRLAPYKLGLSMAMSTVSKGLVSDGAMIGHAFRREWWPLGAVALAAGAFSRSTPARLVTGLMMAPMVLDWVRQRPDVDPLVYVVLRLLDDAAYGTGVIAGSIRAATIAPLLPEIRLPKAEGRQRNGDVRPGQCSLS
ncbi:MAG: mycofactocin biosynthesis glycosyltransferase MftF [Acidimicrobiales bacterium]